MSIVNDAIQVLNPNTAGKFLAAKKAQPVSQTLIYVAILALATLLGTLASSFYLLGGLAGIVFVVALIGYIGAIVAVIGAGFILAALSQSLTKKKISNDEAVTLVGYAATPYLLGGLFNIIPFVGWIIGLLAGLYSVYLLYLGSGAKYGKPNALGVTIVTVVAIFVIALIFGLISGAIIGGMLVASMKGAFVDAALAGY